MKVLTYSLFCLVGGVTTAAEPLDRSGSLWSPFIEWTLKAANPSGNPFDVEGTVTFAHQGSGERHTTGIFYDTGDDWKFRFTGTKTGVWSFVTKSPIPALNGKSGTVTIARNAQAGRRGFITSVDGNKWAWEIGETGEVRPFVPQLVMGRDLPAYLDTRKIEQDIQTLLVDHGFSGLHVAVMCRWFDFDQMSADRITSADPNPDPRTFRILEELVTRLHRAGGMLHLWMWGDESRRMTPAKWGLNGKVDQRLQRYIAARLGPLPGWSMSYGFDLWEWVKGEQLKTWHTHMHQHLGWRHLLGARWENNQLTQATEVLDYASYEQHRPDYKKYVETLARRPSKPAFSEDRFRVRQPSPYPDKDYDLELTRRGLWHSTMAGGIANIWGYLVPTADQGASRPYPNREEIQCYARFFEHRFLPGMKPANHLTDGVALTSKTLHIFYKENTDSIRLDLSTINGPAPAIAVDTKKAYRELTVDLRPAHASTWKAPYASDWVLCVGKIED